FWSPVRRSLGRLLQTRGCAGCSLPGMGNLPKVNLRYSERDSWDRMLQQGIQLLDRFCQDGRRRRHLQMSSARNLAAGFSDGPADRVGEFLATQRHLPSESL